MESILDAINEWIKEILIGAINGNLSTMFGDVNEKVGTIAAEVGKTPQGWNANIFNMIQNLSENVIVPIAGLVITYVLCYELISMVTEKNNMHDVDTFLFFKWFFKAFVAVFLVTHTFDITMAVFDMAQHIVSGAAGVIGGDTNIDVTEALAAIGSQFTNEWFNEHFPSPEILLYILIGANCIAVCVILTTKFSKNLRVQLAPLFEATEQVAQQNLDFEVGHSKIREFEDALCSFANMKDNLKMSLEKQWHAEQLQREQIAALAHDLKTPLTVIQGNIDLINETELDDEQRLYADYITESSSQISIYIKTLIDISRTVAGYQLHLEEIDISDYMGQIEAQANSLCLTKGICLHMETEVDLGIFKADKLLLERAIMNVISNALDYSPPLGTIYVTTKKVEHFLHISITDEGTGFTSEAIHHAQEQFFMGDKSRTSNMHFGMGLYITNSIIKQHDGQLILSNSKKTGGAQVIIKIPY